jgi:ATP/maltotriose-dependent transcriptional regulator MalT
VYTRPAVVLDGPAGIGKTSLVAAARRLAADRGLRSLAARGGELERDFAYGVVRQLFEAPVAAAAPATRQSWLQGAAALSAPILGVAEPGRPGHQAGQHGNDPLFGDDPTAAALHGLYWLTVNMELAHACGARALVARAREELLATGARPRRIVRTGADALTASERRVARMAAEGMTNREIAQALFVTMRTVEVHLTHAYQKLGISSREKLPAALG